MDIKKEHPYEQTDVIMQNLLMLESFHRKVGRNMMEDKDIEIKDAPKALWDAPFALLSHEFGDSEAKYDYANKAALDLFETQWDQLVGKPSTITSPEDQQVRGDREQLLQQAREKGTVEIKDAIRRTLKGAKIQLTSGVLWTIEAPTGKQVLGRVRRRIRSWVESVAGELLGQAVQINEWELEDGTRGGPLASGAGPSAEAAPAASSAATADPEAVTAAEAAVENQGQLVRDLKETHGKANSDIEEDGSDTSSKRPRGFSRYVKKRKLDPLDNYIPALLQARLQLETAGKVMGGAVGEYAVQYGASEGQAKQLVANFNETLTAYDLTLFYAIRDDGKLPDIAPQQLEDTIAALDRRGSVATFKHPQASLLKLLLHGIPESELQKGQQVLNKIQEVMASQERSQPEDAAASSQDTADASDDLHRSGQ
eukprot:jgi/Astpho2/5660/Aster-x1308